MSLPAAIFLFVLHPWRGGVVQRVSLFRLRAAILRGLLEYLPEGRLRGLVPDIRLLWGPPTSDLCRANILLPTVAHCSQHPPRLVPAPSLFSRWVPPL